MREKSNPPSAVIRPENPSSVRLLGGGALVAAKVASFPLTPALSPEERGNPRLRDCKSEARRLTAPQDIFLPLPRGEGTAKARFSNIVKSRLPSPSDRPCCKGAFGFTVGQTMLLPLPRRAARSARAQSRQVAPSQRVGGEGRGEGEADVPPTRCAPIAAGARVLPEGPHGFGPFIVSNQR